MQRIKYLNQFNEPCIRHGIVKKENGETTFLPNDSTRIINIPKENVKYVVEAEQTDEFYEHE